MMHQVLSHNIGERFVEETLQSIYTPEVFILPSPESVDFQAAQLVLEQIAQKPHSVLTLPTGSTPIGMYKNLIEAYQGNRADFSQVTTFNLDEYYPIDPKHPTSYAAFMQEQLFDHINIPKEQRFIPNGMAENPEEEAARYRQLLEQYGPPDLAILGIGPGKTCHIAFNERGSTVDSHVRLVDIDAETRVANARFFQEGEIVPTSAFTQGIADILSAKHILLIAKGEGKAWGIQRALEGEIGPNAPASFLRYHPNVTVMLDQGASALLTHK